MNIMDIFYNEIIKEAAKGEIHAYMNYNIIFSTNIENTFILQANNDCELLIPSLTIKNKEYFNQLLKEYFLIAYPFYANKMPSELNNHEKAKTILTLLWSNATSNDFMNPEEYLKKRIAFIEDQNISSDEFAPKETSIGTINLKVEKDEVYNETPYQLKIYINDNLLPVVRFGIYKNKAYIYAIQNEFEKPRDKKLNRNMYKVNEGIDLKLEESDNINYPENLKGVTPSTLISATISIAYLKSLGINEFIMPVLLPVRWNAKELAIKKRYNYYLKKGRVEDNYLIDNQAKHEEIQRNLSDKFIRTFRRLEYHFLNMEITALPFIHDEELHLKVSDFMECNNPLLEELYKVINEKRSR